MLNCMHYKKLGSIKKEKFSPTPVIPSSASTSTITELIALMPHDLERSWYWQLRYMT